MKCNIKGNYLPSNYEIARNIRKTCETNGYSDDISSLLANLFTYMMEKNICGCCHAFSSVLYVAFSELGYSMKFFFIRLRIF